MTTNTINIFLLGCRAAGKTSFISGLSILSRVGYGGSFRLTPNDKRTTNMISDLRKIADRREWPPATSNLVPLDFDLEYSERPFRVSILDYPGEDLRDAMETMDLESKELIFDRINRADCLLIMMDPYQDLRTTLNSNLLVAGRRQDALATAVSYLVKYRTDKRRILPLVAFVISKADLLNKGSSVDLKTIVSRNEGLLKKMWSYGRNRGKIRCFAVSACGTLAGQRHDGSALERGYPENPCPHGYEELFTWLSEQRAIRKWKKPIAVVAAALMLVLLFVIGFSASSAVRDRRIVSWIETLAADELSNKLRDHDSLSDNTKGALDRRLAVEIDSVEVGLEVASTGEDINRLRDQVLILLDLRHCSRTRDLQSLLDQIEARQDESLYAAIKAAMRSGNRDRTLLLCADYRTGFESGLHKDEIRKIEEDLKYRGRQELRSSARSIRISNRDSLNRKAAQIKRYLAAFPDDPESERMEMAVVLCEKLAADGKIRLTVTKYGYSSSMGVQYQELRWYTSNNRVSALALFSKNNPATAKKSYIFPFSQWSTIRIEMWNTHELFDTDDLMAKGRLDVLQDLAGLDGKGHFRLSNENSDRWAGVESWVSILASYRDESDGSWSAIDIQDLSAYGSYVSPGSRW